MEARPGSRTRSRLSHAALLFKVAAVRLALFLKTIPVAEPSSTGPAVTTKNVCRVTATGRRREEAGAPDGTTEWLDLKKTPHNEKQNPTPQGRNKGWEGSRFPLPPPSSRAPRGQLRTDGSRRPSPGAVPAALQPQPLPAPLQGSPHPLLLPLAGGRTSQAVTPVRG